MRGEGEFFLRELFPSASPHPSAPPDEELTVSLRMNLNPCTSGGALGGGEGLFSLFSVEAFELLLDVRACLRKISFNGILTVWD